MYQTGYATLLNTGITGSNSISTTPVYLDGYTVSASLTSNPIDLRNIRYLAVMVSFTSGTNAGTVSLQVSNDAVDPVTNLAVQTANWTIPTVGGNTATLSVSGGAANYTFEYPNVCHRWARIIYTNTSGSGVFNVSFNIKD